jgi:hypothetical protein
MKKTILLSVIITFAMNAFSQSDVAGIFGHQRQAGRFVGWSPGVLGSVAGSLDVKNEFANQPINFFAGGAGAAFQRMTINGTTGFVGIGPNSLAPTFQLGVDNNININTNTYANNTNNTLGYRINGIKILNNPGQFNLFVGENAGLNNQFNTITSPGSAQAPCNFNTFLGHNAGRNNTTGFENTYVGEGAGQSNSTGEHNTFVGRAAGLFNTTGSFNTFLGAHSGQSTPAGGTGSNNTFVGHSSGLPDLSGNENTAVGSDAGRLNTNGMGNAFFGFEAGHNNNNGDYNCYYGYRSTYNPQLNDSCASFGAFSAAYRAGMPLQNATAIGANAIARVHRTIILGANYVNVGIGLSANNNGPMNKLEINSNLANSTSNDPAIPGSIPGTTGASGLRFRDLKVGSTALPVNPHTIPAVLTVDANGDVILTRDNIAALGNACAATTTNPLPSNWEIPLDNHNFIFSNPDAGTGTVGIGDITTACSPINTLEIGAVNNNESGLSFTKLSNTSPAIVNPTIKVLSVDAGGKVILVNDQVGAPGTFAGSQNGITSFATVVNPLARVQLGQDAGQGGSNPARLLNDREIPMNGFNLILNTNTGGNVGGNFVSGGLNNTISSRSNNVFGTLNTLNANNTVFGANFVVGRNNTIDNAETQTFGNFNTVRGEGDFVVGNSNLMNTNSVGGSNYALGTTNTMDGVGNVCIGFANFAVVDPVYNTTPGKSYLIGNDSYIYDNKSIVIGNKVIGAPGGDVTGGISGGIISIGSTGAPVGPLFSYFGASGGGGINVVRNAHTVPGIMNTNMIPAINVSNNQVAIKKYIADNVALDVNGSILMNGVLVLTSDSTLKTNIQPIPVSAADKIKQFRPVTFEWINKLDTAMYGTHYGFTAQQIESILPNLVKTGSDGIKTLNYTEIIPLLVKSVQEQQNTIDSLKDVQNEQDSINNSVRHQLEQLTALVNSCCQNGARTQNPNAMNVELSNKDIIVLNQNVPNPFTEQTTITFNIPEKTGFAQIIFNDMKGQIIKVTDIKTKGQGQLSVFANDLSTGMYSYSLYVDGKLISTKKMVKTE